MVFKGTTQESVRGPHLFNLFMVKYADDSTILVTVNEDVDNSQRALSHFMDWTNNNNMKCNTDKCKELVVRNRLTIQYIRLYIISSNMIMLPCLV